LGRVQYYFNDEEDTDGFGDLELVLDDNTYLTLLGAGDATSIRAANAKANIPEPIKVTDNDEGTWKRHELKEDEDWKILIGQVLISAEVEWMDDRLIACALHFDSDFLIFYETGADANKFFLNKPFDTNDPDTRIEKIIQ